MIAMKKKGGYPRQVQPSRPGIAKIHRSDRQHSPNQAHPRHGFFRPSLFRSIVRERLELAPSNGRMARGVTSEVQSPNNGPGHSNNSENHKRASPRYRGD